MTEYSLQGDLIRFHSGLAPAMDADVVVLRKKDTILPQPYTIDEKGMLHFQLYYPNAEKVMVKDYSKQYKLVKKGNFWCGECDFGKGMISLFLEIDGSNVLSKYLPIGYGGNEPINFVEVPEPDFAVSETGFPHGTLQFDFLESNVTGRMERIAIYLPPDYHESGLRRYPVLYLQHGHGENEICWGSQGRVNFIYDNLIAAGKAVPAIVVMANGMIYRENEKERILEYEKLEEFLVKELISYIDGKYRTVRQKDGRAMAGLSMGSFQTSMTVFKNAALFSYAGLFSGFVQNPMEDNQKHLTEENIKLFQESIKLFFRGIGEEDEYLSLFEKDDDLLKEQGISCLRRVYSGGHEWKVWRRCLYEFAQVIFK